MRIIAISQLIENKVALEQRASLNFQVELDPPSSSEELEAY